MDNPLRFDDLPPALRRLAAAIQLVAAVGILWSWRTLPAVLERPVVPWAAIVIGAAISLGAIALLTKTSISLLRQPTNQPAWATTPPRHRAFTYYLASIAFAIMAAGTIYFGETWYAGLIFLLLSVGALGEAHRAKRATTA